MGFDLIKVINTVAAPIDEIQKEVSEFKKANINKSDYELADKFCSQIIRNYTSVGAASALPSVIPGLGTAAQIAVEASTISADLALMLRWMSKMCYRVGLIYGRDMRLEGNLDLIRILGLWCGVIKAAQKGIQPIAVRVALAQLKRISPQLLKKITEKVGFQLVTKYGSKRGGIALGKIIPLGIGVAVSSSFNYLTMRAFKKNAMEYYASDNNKEYTIDV